MAWHGGPHTAIRFRWPMCAAPCRTPTPSKVHESVRCANATAYLLHTVRRVCRWVQGYAVGLYAIPYCIRYTLLWTTHCETDRPAKYVCFSASAADILPAAV